MPKGSPFRRVATVAAVFASTLLAACGVMTRPLPAVIGAVQSLATRAPAVTRHYGWKFDAKTPKVRYTTGRLSAGMPDHVDLRAQMSPIDDQGALNSCTGFALAGLAEFRAKRAGQPTELSPAFIYKLELLQEDTVGEDEGARIRTGVSILQEVGVCPEAMHPYLAVAKQNDINVVHQWLSVMPTSKEITAAMPYKLAKTKPVEDLNGFKVALAKGHPVVFGIQCAKSFESDTVKKTGIVPVPDPALEPFVGGHAILAVGYDEAKQQILFRNSYSPTWGDQGYGYLPYGYFKQELVGDAWESD